MTHNQRLVLMTLTLIRGSPPIDSNQDTNINISSNPSPSLIIYKLILRIRDRVLALISSVRVVQYRCSVFVMNVFPCICYQTPSWYLIFDVLVSPALDEQTHTLSATIRRSRNQCRLAGLYTRIKCVWNLMNSNKLKNVLRGRSQIHGRTRQYIILQ